MTAHLRNWLAGSSPDGGTRARRVRAALLAILALGGGGGALAAGLGPRAGARAAAASADSVTVAVVWPWVARRDLGFAEGVALAQDSINRTGGVQGRPLRILREDDHESVNDGLLVAQRLARTPGLLAVVGHLQSYVALPAAAVYDAAGLVYVAPTASDPALTRRGYARTFRPTLTDGVIGRGMADVAAARGFRRLAIYYVRNEYGRSLANAFESRAGELGMQVLQRSSYEPGERIGTSGFEATLRDWRQLEIEGVFIAGQVPEAGWLAIALRRAGIRATILGGDAMAVPPLVHVGGRDVEGAILPVPFHFDESRPDVQGFQRAYAARHAARAELGAAVAFDAIMRLGAAMRAADSLTPSAVARALHAPTPWRGLTGDIRFDARGDLVGRDPLLLTVRDGRFVPAPTLAAVPAADTMELYARAHR